MAAQCAVRLGRLNRFSPVPGARKQLLSLVGREHRSIRVETSCGFELSLPCFDTYLMGCVLRGEVYESRLADVLHHAVRPGFVIVDGGAHAGFFTVLAAKRLEGRGRVFAFEPDARNFRILLHNIATNGLGEVVVAEPKVLAEATGTYRLWTFSGITTKSSLLRLSELDQQGETVPGVALDEYLAQQGVQHVDVLKLDLEGAEARAFQGMQGTLETTELLIYEIAKPYLDALGVDPLHLINQTIAWGRFTITRITDEHTNQILRVDDKRWTRILKENGWANVICAKGEAAEHLSPRLAG